MGMSELRMLDHSWSWQVAYNCGIVACRSVTLLAGVILRHEMHWHAACTMCPDSLPSLLHVSDFMYL